MEDDPMDIDGPSFEELKRLGFSSLDWAQNSGTKRTFEVFDQDNGVKARMSAFTTIPAPTPRRILTPPGARPPLSTRRARTSAIQRVALNPPTTFLGRVGSLIHHALRHVRGWYVGHQGYVTVETDTSRKRRAIEIPGGFPGLYTPPSSKTTRHDSPMENDPVISPTHAPQVTKDTNTTPLAPTHEPQVTADIQTTPISATEEPQVTEDTKTTIEVAQQTYEHVMPGTFPTEEEIHEPTPILPSPWTRAVMHAEAKEEQAKAEAYERKVKESNERMAAVLKKAANRKMPAEVQAEIARKMREDARKRKEQRDAAVDDLVNRVNNALVSPLGKVSLTSSWMIRKQREREAEEAKVREEQQLNRQFKEQVQQQLAQEYDAKQQEEAKQQALEEAARQLKEQAQQQLAEEHEAKQQKAEEAARQKAIEEAEEASKQKAAEDIKQRLIRELPSEWAARVDTAMAGTNRRETLATSIEGNGLSRHDFGCLLPQPGTEDSPSGWLNDEIVNAWISAIVEEKNIAKDFTKAGNRVPTFAAYSSAWFNTVKDKGMDAISRWSRRKHISGTNLLHCEKVFLPINTGSHWQLLIISPKQKTIEFLDSLRTTSRRRYFLQLGRDWVKMELGKKYVAEEWTESPSESAMQMNEDDCGAFVCFNALIAAKGREYDEMKQYNMKEGRRLMAAILINGGFTGDWML